MIIECKKCKSLFRLDEGLLREDGSKVRCSVCRHVFISYPPGWELGAEEKPGALDRSLGETVTLESPPVLEDEEPEPLLEDADDRDFEAAFEEEEAETNRLQAVSPDPFPQQEAKEGDEEFHLEMDDREEEEIEPEPEVLFLGSTGAIWSDSWSLTREAASKRLVIATCARPARTSWYSVAGEATARISAFGVMLFA